MPDSSPSAEDFAANNVVAFSEHSLGGAETRGPITGGGGGSGMNDGERISRLETHFEYIRKDLDDIKVGQKEVLERVRELPTKGDLWAWKIQWTAIAVAAIAIIVGGIIGGLSWIKSETAPTYMLPQQQTQQSLESGN